MIPNKFPVCILCFNSVKKEGNVHVACSQRKLILSGIDDEAKSYEDTLGPEDDGKTMEWW